MKNNSWILILASLLTATGCQLWNAGTSGSGSSQTGAATGTSEAPPGIAKAHPFQRSGMADANVAMSRSEATLDTSPSGAAELTRRSASAAVGKPAETINIEQPETQNDRMLSDRVRQALTTDTTGPSTPVKALSIQDADGIRISSRNGIVTLRGFVKTDKEKQAIGTRVRQVEDVEGVNNQLELAEPNPKK